MKTYLHDIYTIGVSKECQHRHPMIYAWHKKTQLKTVSTYCPICNRIRKFKVTSYLSITEDKE